MQEPISNGILPKGKVLVGITELWKVVERLLFNFLFFRLIDYAKKQSNLLNSNIYSPVTTACFSVVTAEEAKSEEWKGYEVGEIKDKEFLKYIAEQNLQFGFINFYCGETSQLSSCCRLRSGTNNEYFKKN